MIRAIVGVAARAMAGTAAVLIAGCATAPAAEPVLPAFEQALAAQDSATAALTRWCAVRHLAQPARITARPVRDADAAVPAALRQMLRTGPAGAIGYRHVRLSCGPVVLSEAHNWYLSASLTPAMNTALAATDIPFGKVAAPLHFIRERLAAERGRAAGCPPRTVLSHRALLRLPDGTPLALVLECYTAANLQNP